MHALKLLMNQCISTSAKYLCQLFNRYNSVALLFKVLKSCSCDFFPPFQSLKLVRADCCSTEFFKVHLSVRKWFQLWRTQERDQQLQVYNHQCQETCLKHQDSGSKLRVGAHINITISITVWSFASWWILTACKNSRTLDSLIASVIYLVRAWAHHVEFRS